MGFSFQVYHGLGKQTYSGYSNPLKNRPHVPRKNIKLLVLEVKNLFQMFVNGGLRIAHLNVMSRMNLTYLKLNQSLMSRGMTIY